MGYRRLALPSCPTERRALFVLICFGVVAAGCGVDHKRYDAGKVVACLRAQEVVVAKDRANAFAPTSRDFVIQFPHGNVLLAFAPAEGVAEDVEGRVRSVAVANGAARGGEDVVRRKRNLVYWVNAQAFPAGLTQLLENCV